MKWSGGLIILGVLCTVLSVGAVWGFAPLEFFDRQEIQVSLHDVPEAPIELLQANGSLLVSKPGPPGQYALGSPSAAISQVAGWHSSINYRNRSKRDVVAVRFRWEFFDAFDDSLGTLEVTGHRRLSPSQTDEQEWEQPASLPEATRATLTVEMVRFDNGTIWRTALQHEVPRSPSDTHSP